MAKRIASVGVDPESADKAFRTEAELDGLTRRIDQMELLMDAMWVLLERAGYRRKDLEAVIQALNEADGANDGRRSPQGTKCRSCGAMVEGGRTSCTFCGKAVAH